MIDTPERAVEYWRANIPFSCELKKISADTGLQKMIEAIEVKIKVFDQLRREWKNSNSVSCPGRDATTA